jgi:polyhydroxybutyrate depolymerase
VLILTGCPENRPMTLDQDGEERSFLVTVPPQYDESEPIPLLIALHPLQSTGRQMRDVTELDDLAKAEGFIAVFPDAKDKIWNLGGINIFEPSDIEFISLLIDFMADRYAVDAGRVYLVGASMGALMTYQAACELTDRIAGVGVVMGATMPSFLAENCVPSAPMPLIAIHGTADETLPIDGGLVLVKGIPLPVLFWSAEESLGFWAENNGCAGTVLSVDLPDSDPSDGTTVRQETYIGCPAAAPVVFYRVEGGGHTWPRSGPRFDFKDNDDSPNRRVSNDIDASRLVWDFLREQRR